VGQSVRKERGEGIKEFIASSKEVLGELITALKPLGPGNLLHAAGNRMAKSFFREGRRSVHTYVRTCVVDKMRGFLRYDKTHKKGGERPGKKRAWRRMSS